MKKTKIFSLLAALLTAGFVACNNEEADSSAAADTTASESGSHTTAGTTQTSSGDYTALADSFSTNSEAGHYLDPRTGRPIRINIDRQTGKATNAETGAAVTRYVDRRTWWVYSGDEGTSRWDTIGTARMQGDKILYRGDQDKWVTYEERWKTETEKDGDFKAKSEDLKIKTEKDGDIKIKTENDKKIKVDEDGVKADDNK